MSSNSVAALQENPEGEGEVVAYWTEEPHCDATEHEEGRGGQNPDGLEPSHRSPQFRQNSRGGKGIRREGTGENPANRRKKTLLQTHGDERAEFYQMYRGKAEEHDQGFIAKYDADLNNTLIFAGLFSAVTSAFIIQVQPQLQPDSGDETAALLRVLIYKIDNTTFGNDIPALPQWPGPPPTIVQVQAILYASLVISLLAAFLAMVGKQWLNQYASVDTRGSTIERCQNRQQKFDGTVTWRFELVMESLPLMLQGALFLLGCALSLYLWGIDAIIASVVLGFTLLGALFYGFVVVAGTASLTCPYQTPHARVFRYIIYRIPFISSRLISAASPVALYIETAASSIKCGSKSIAVLSHCLKKYRLQTYAIVLPLYFLALPALLVYDAWLLAVAIFKGLSALAYRAYIRFHTRKFAPETDSLSDIQCILWILQASTDKAARLPALKLLATAAKLVDFSPTIISTCFDILIGYVAVVGDKAVIPRESEELAKVSSCCFLRTLFHMDPQAGTVEPMRVRYTGVFPPATNFDALEPNHSLRTIHNIFYSLHAYTQQNGHDVLTNLTYTFTELAHKDVFGALLQGRQHMKVPRWILRFALHHLSRDPPPPTSIVINCLSVIAIDLGCSIPPNTVIDDESTWLKEISVPVTNRLRTMAGSGNGHYIECKRKAITALFPYAVWRERKGDGDIMEALLAVFMDSGPTMTLWHPIAPFITTLFKAASPKAIVVTSPHVPWYRIPDDASVVAVWAARASEVPGTDPELGRRVVDALLQLASVDSLRPHIPDGRWSLLNKRPSLPPYAAGGRWQQRNMLSGGSGNLKISKFSNRTYSLSGRSGIQLVHRSWIPSVRMIASERCN